MSRPAHRPRVNQLRHTLEAEISRLILLLDALDVDPDLEADHDGREPSEDFEHSLGWSADESERGRLHAAWQDLELDEEAA